MFSEEHTTKYVYSDGTLTSNCLNKRFVWCIQVVYCRGLSCYFTFCVVGFHCRNVFGRCRVPYRIRVYLRITFVVVVVVVVNDSPLFPFLVLSPFSLFKFKAYASTIRYICIEPYAVLCLCFNFISEGANDVMFFSDKKKNASRTCSIPNRWRNPKRIQR